MASRTVEGTVIAQHGRWVRVSSNGETIVAACRRQLSWQGEAPAAGGLVVGDQVTVEQRRDRGLVVNAHGRRTSLLRRSPKTGQAQVLVANVDQALLVFAAHQPEPNRRLLDRFLVASSAAGIRPIICINKIDLGAEAVDGWLPVYRRLGYQVLCTSALHGQGVAQVQTCLVAQITVLCGPSGVGKSSLLNAVAPGLALTVGAVSESTGKGRHTTSRAELLPVPTGGLVVDTPGIKELGLWQVDADHLRAAFAELDEPARACRFGNCSHSHEPGCGVIAAVAAGTVDPARYESYLALLGEC